MTKRKSLIYYRVKKTLIQKGINSCFNFKIYEKGKVDAALKSISICSENVAIGYGRMVCMKRLGDNTYYKTYHCLGDVNIVKFRDPGVLAIGLQNGIVECVATCSLQRMATLKGHTAAVNDVIFCSDFQHMFTCSRDGTIKKWDIWKSTCVLTLNYHTDSVKNLLTHDHYKGKTYLISSGYDGHIYFYNVKKNKLRNKLKIDVKEPIEHMCIFRKKYIIFSVKNVVKIYSFQTNKIIKNFFVCSKTVFYLSSFKNHILAASLDKNVYFINPYKQIVEEEAVVVGNCRFANFPVCICVYKNVVMLGESRSNWCIQIHNSEVMKTVNENSKDVRLHELVKQNYECQNKKLYYLLKAFKYQEALYFGIQHEKHCLPNLLDLTSKHRVFDVVCKVHTSEEMLVFLKWILKIKNINEVILEMIGSFLYMNKTVGLENNKIKAHMQQLLYKLEMVQFWIRAYKELATLIPQLTA